MRTVEFTIAAARRLEWALAKAAYAMPAFQSYFLPNVRIVRPSPKSKKSEGTLCGLDSTDFEAGRSLLPC